MSEAADDGFDSVFYAFFVRYVAGEERSVSSCIAQFLRLFFSFLINVHDGNGCTVGGEHLGHGKTDAAACARNDRHFSGQIQGISFLDHREPPCMNHTLKKIDNFSISII